MLRIKVPVSPEGWDDEKQEFIEPEVVVLDLEHSLVSVSEWESKWCKAFLSKVNKTDEEIMDYIKCMTITPNVSPDVYNHLTAENFREINAYIEAPMTATYFSEDKNSKGSSREVVTSELIYYWMIALTIPSEYDKWHLNRLLTLIRICNIKNSPPKKRSSTSIAKDYAALNAARRAQLNTKG